MEEIEALPWNGFRVASTFSGCGDSYLWFKFGDFAGWVIERPA